MSNYIKYYKHKNNKSQTVYGAYFIDARGKFPKDLLPSNDYYYVEFREMEGDYLELFNFGKVIERMKMEKFNEFIKDYEEVKENRDEFLAKIDKLVGVENEE